MTRFNVVVKDWKTGEVKYTYTNLTEDQLRAVECNNHQHEPASWDMEITKIEEQEQTK